MNNLLQFKKAEQSLYDKYKYVLANKKRHTITIENLMQSAGQKASIVTRNIKLENQLKEAIEIIQRIKDSYKTGDLDEIGIECLCEDFLAEYKKESKQ